MGLFSRRTSTLDAGAALAAWQELAIQLTPTTTSDQSAADLVRAVGRLTGATDPGPLFTAGVTDRLPPRARLVLVAGPVRSGKTVCSRRLVHQTVADRRHVTVIRTVNGPGAPDEYTFTDLPADKVTVIDADPLCSQDERYLLTSHLRYDASTSEMVIVDAHLPFPDQRALIRDLHRQWLVPQRDATLVVLTPDVWSVSERSFDTRIVLPGAVRNAHQGQTSGYLQDLHIDELTRSRLTARMSGGGLARSHAETRVLGWFPPGSDAISALAPHQTQIVEEPMPTVGDGLQHGVLQGPDLALAEFTLPTTIH